MQISIYDQTGKEKSKQKLESAIFEVTPNPVLMHGLLVMQLHNKRYNLARALTKGEVRGGGKKPYRQKGTGRARQGSTRNPHYVGGGVAHGPRGQQAFRKRMNKKSRRQALFGYLTIKAADKKIIGLEKYDKDISTKTLKTLIDALPVEKNVLFVLGERNDKLYRSCRNIDNAKAITAGYVNPVDLSKYDTVCFVADALDSLKETFISK